MDKLISLDAVLNYVSRAARKEASDLQIKSDALQCYKSLQSGMCTIEDFTISKIVNNRVDLPYDAKCINKVQWMCSDPTATEEEDLLCSIKSCNEEEACPSDCLTDYFTRDYNLCRYTLNHSLWIDSNYYKNNFVYLKYAGARSKYINRNCMMQGQACNESWSYDSESNSILVSAEEGYLYVEYQRLPRENGQVLIPNDTDLLQGLAWWCEYKIADERAWMKEQSMAQMSVTKLQQAESRLKRYRGKNLLRGIDIQLHDYIGGTSSDSQLLLRYNLNG